MMNMDWLYSTAIGSVVLILTYVACNQKLNMPSRPSIIISMAFAIITTGFLLENPQIMYSTVYQIAMALIGSVVLLAIFIKRNATKP